MKIVFDLDGTLADATHRLHLIKRAVPEWDAFFNACVHDLPIELLIGVFSHLRRPASRFDASDRHSVEIWTGRPERIRAHTLGWLALHVDRDPLSIALRMRADDDRREDYEVKAGFIGKYGKPDLVFEDRSQVVRMYRERGIRVAQVAEGNY